MSGLIFKPGEKRRGEPMKIIDAHFHFADFSDFDKLARMAGHENTEENLRQSYKSAGIVHGIVMSNRSLYPEEHRYPEFINYCIGLDHFDDDKRSLREQAELVEANLKRPRCVGIKLYPGYNRFYVYDDRLAPFYELAEKYDKPVAVHTGLTATETGLLKYSHPFTLDEAAVNFRNVRFVMCHMGNPFLDEAVAVLEKNHNVSTDLSGLLEGKISDTERFFYEKYGYIRRLYDLFSYMGDYSRILFGTDWPLANLDDYINFVKAVIPRDKWDDVFYNNAVRIYGLQGNGIFS
mgnify:FL=1|jgi:hypothetical protein